MRIVAAIEPAGADFVNVEAVVGEPMVSARVAGSSGVDGAFVQLLKEKASARELETAD